MNFYKPNEQTKNRVHLKLSLLFFALFFSIVMLRYEASQALQREMLRASA